MNKKVKWYDGRSRGTNHASVRFNWVVNYIIKNGPGEINEIIRKKVIKEFAIGIDRGRIQSAKNLVANNGRQTLLREVEVEPAKKTSPVQTEMVPVIEPPLSNEEYYVQSVAKEVGRFIRELHQMKELVKCVPSIKVMKFLVEADGYVTASYKLEKVQELEGTF